MFFEKILRRDKINLNTAFVKSIEIEILDNRLEIKLEYP